MQLCIYAIVQICKCANMQVSKGASMQLNTMSMQHIAISLVSHDDTLFSSFLTPHDFLNTFSLSVRPLVCRSVYHSISQSVGWTVHHT